MEEGRRSRREKSKNRLGRTKIRREERCGEG